MVEATAPGKLLITGEYAVLDKATAVAVAIDVRASASVGRISGRDSVLFDPALGRAFDFRFDDRDGLLWIDESPGDRGRVIESVCNVLAGRMPHFGALPSIKVTLDTDDFYRLSAGRPEKLGLGSSAAILVAFAGALSTELAFELDRPSLHAICHEAHRRMQQTHGSGVDVAIAIDGGVLAVRPADSGRVPVGEKLDWPAGLHLLPVWTGSGAPTPVFLERFAAYRERDPIGCESHMSTLRNFARRSAAAWSGGSVADIMMLAERYAEAIAEFDRDSEIGIVTGAHETLRAMAERHGAVYKTSGAGGGDFGIVLADDPASIQSVREDFAAAGYFVPDQPLGRHGLAVQR